MRQEQQALLHQASDTEPDPYPQPVGTHPRWEDPILDSPVK